MIDFVSKAPSELAECPIWDRRTGAVYWIDIDGRSVHQLDVGSGSEARRSLAGRPGSIALTEDPSRLLLATEHEVGWFEWEQGEFTAWRALEVADTGNRLNDGRTDPAGRFWVGSMHTAASDDLKTGMLHRMDPDGASETVRRGVGVSNGLAFSPDGTTMYHADTLCDTVWAYDYEPTTGERRRERVFTDFADLPGSPDGACVDAAGCYWVACVFGWTVARLTPDGDVDRIIELPVEKPTMPAFGGPGLDTLFVTSIGGGGTHEVAPNQPEAGRLMTVEVGATGIVEPTFGG